MICGHGTYPPLPACPHPDIGTAIHNGTAFTGTDIGVVAIVLVMLVLAAALFLFLSWQFGREGER